MSSSNFRYCAFCLTTLSSTSILLCGGCRRRSYCSKECQKKDWKPGCGGQGHKNWCSLMCGEEEVDWMVCEIAGKGLGLRAKHFIPALTRIMVDGPRAHNDPVLLDLEPKHGTLQEKIKLNAVGDLTGGSHVCARISRVNHDCWPNASHIYDENLNVKILISERDIQEEEEITISYVSCFDPANSMNSIQCAQTLLSQWGIICPDSCRCHDTAREQRFLEAKEIDKSIYTAVSQSDTAAAMRKVEYMLRLHDEIGVLPSTRLRALYDAFQIAIMLRSTLPKAKVFSRQAKSLALKIYYPRSKEVLEWKIWNENPSSHINYLTCEYPF